MTTHDPSHGLDEITWAPRVPKRKIRRLYQLEAKGVLDEEVLEDVGFTLLLRCESILTIRDAREGRVRCPRCARSGATTVIKRTDRSDRDEVLTCRRCNWQVTWRKYHSTFKGKQLYSGSAVRGFETYVRSYVAARTPKDKILAIDRLIHEFHYSYRWQPDLPTRSVGPNLIQGKLGDVLHFLDELSYGPRSTVGLVERRAEWEGTLAANQRAMMGVDRAADIVVEQVLGVFDGDSIEAGIARLRQEVLAAPDRFLWANIALEVLLMRESEGGLKDSVVERLTPYLPASAGDLSGFLMRVYEGVFRDLL